MATPNVEVFGYDILDRMERAVQAVRDRLRRATIALAGGAVEHAVAGGNAVAAWVASIDPGAVRNTPDVDLLLRRSDLDAATEALVAAGFHRNDSSGFVIFLDGSKGKLRAGVHIFFAGEKVKDSDAVVAPDVTDVSTTVSKGFRILALEPLVRLKLTAYRLKDQVHIQDMIGVGLIDSSWAARFPPELAARLQTLLDDPNG
jgi:hypothetical protein